MYCVTIAVAAAIRLATPTLRSIIKSGRNTNKQLQCGIKVDLDLQFDSFLWHSSGLLSWPTEMNNVSNVTFLRQLTDQNSLSVISLCWWHCVLLSTPTPDISPSVWRFFATAGQHSINLRPGPFLIPSQHHFKRAIPCTLLIYSLFRTKHLQNISSSLLY